MAEPLMDTLVGPEMCALVEWLEDDEAEDATDVECFSECFFLVNDPNILTDKRSVYFIASKTQYAAFECKSRQQYVL